MKFTNFLFSFIFFFLIFTILEIGAMIFHHAKLFPQLTKDISIDRREHFKKHLMISSFSKEMFCDYIHKTEKGHLLTANILDQNVNIKLYHSVWFMGGSTIQGMECDGNKTFVDYLNDLYPDKNFKNYGKSNMNSDYSLMKINQNLMLGKKPDLIVWGHWINEFLLSGDSLDPNFDILSNKFKLEKNHSSTKAMKFLQRINISLYRHSDFYKILTYVILNTTNQFSSQLFLRHHGDTEDENIPFFSNSFGGSRSRWIEYSLLNYTINLHKLKKISSKYNIKVILIMPPRIKDYYIYDTPILNTFLEKEWFARIDQLLQKISKKNDWLYLNLNPLFHN